MSKRTHLLRSGDRFRREYAILLVVLAALGLWFRIRHLGDLSLTADEGIEALAVQGVLQHGWPEVESGLIYGRWPLYLYMQAALAYLFELDPFWLRLPSVLWSVATIVPAYVLGKLLFNRPVGALAAAILAVSVWEIELSRYARAYTAFQFFFVTALACFYRGFMRDENNYKVWFLVAACVAMLTHALSDLLITLFLIPLFSPAFTRARKLTFGLWGVGLAALIIIRRKIVRFSLADEALSFPDQEGAAAAGIVDQIRQALGLPPLNLPDMSFFQQAVQQTPALVAALALVAAGATVYLVYRLWQKKGEQGAGGGGWRVVLALFMIWAAVVYQFGLVLIGLIVYLALFARDRRVLRDPALQATLGIAAVCFIGWFAFLVGSTQLGMRWALFTLFGFPDFHGYFFTWLMNGWPIMTVVLLIGSVLLFARYLQDRRDPAALFALGALYIPALFGSLFESYQSSRYIFHLYPLVVIIFSGVVVEVGRYVWNRFAAARRPFGRLAMLLALPILLFASQDANPWRAWAVGERTYQSDRDPNRSVISWWPYAGFHQDHEAPSRFVKERLTEEDEVLVVGVSYMASIYHYYVGQTDYFLAPEDLRYESALIREGEPIHYITGSEIISGVSELSELVQNHEGGLWLLADRRALSEDNSLYSEEVGDFLSSLARDKAYVGRDGITFVVKVR